MERLKKIDLHVHATKTRGLPRENGENMPIPSELMEMYRVLGIEKGVLLPEINVECAYDTATNREVHEIASEYPETFSWFCNIDPRQGSNSPQTDFSHFLRYYKGLGAKGVGEISANVYFDDPRLLNLFAHCEAFDMPVLFHIGNLGGDYGIVDDFGLICIATYRPAADTTPSRAMWNFPIVSWKRFRIGSSLAQTSVRPPTSTPPWCGWPHSWMLQWKPTIFPMPPMRKSPAATR